MLAAAIGFPSAVLADANAENVSNQSSHYFVFDEAALRRDIARVRHFYVDPPRDDVDGAETDSMVFLGGPAQGGFVGFWGSDVPGPATTYGTSSWLDRMEFGFDWRPDVTESQHRSPRAVSRILTTGELERVGLRADLTALLSEGDGSGVGASAWRITGMLGSTSLSLATSDMDPAATEPGVGDLQWDVGVGWSSGAVSLSAGYESTYREVEGTPSGIAILSFGADYAVLPGLLVYGEFNVVDNPTVESDQRLGTVIVLGTGVNF